jgi:hypothetical protein
MYVACFLRALESFLADNVISFHISILTKRKIAEPSGFRVVSLAVFSLWTIRFHERACANHGSLEF